MKNLIKKHGISEDELIKGIEIIAKGLDSLTNKKVKKALGELLTVGDIKKPKSLELNQIIREALKDYRGNDMVIVTTTRGGAVDIEDFDANAIVSENEELEDKVTQLEEEKEELERRIEELEEELE